MRTFLVFLLFASAAFGQTQTAKISGPTKAPAGSLVELKATSNVAAAMTWVTVNGTSASFDYKTYENESVLVFASPNPGLYEFALVVVIVTTDNKPVVSIEKHLVELTGNTPNPPTPPNPGPEPGPTPPPGPEPVPADFVNLTKIAKAKAPQENKNAIRLNFRSLASAVGAGTISDWKDLVTKTASANRQIYGDPEEEGNPWQDFVYDVGFELDKLRQDGKLTTKASWVQAWNAISDGLE